MEFKLKATTTAVVKVKKKAPERMAVAVAGTNVTVRRVDESSTTPPASAE